MKLFLCLYQCEDEEGALLVVINFSDNHRWKKSVFVQSWTSFAGNSATFHDGKPALQDLSDAVYEALTLPKLWSVEQFEFMTVDYNEAVAFQKIQNSIRYI